MERRRLDASVSHARGPSHRLDAVAAETMRRLQEMLARGLNDPRVRGMVSVTGVRIAPDLSEAYVRVSIVPEQHASLSLQGLRHAAGHLQGRLGRAMRMRRIPRLVFELDETLKRQAALELALRQDEAAREADAGQPESASEPADGSSEAPRDSRKDSQRERWQGNQQET